MGIPITQDRAVAPGPPVDRGHLLTLVTSHSVQRYTDLSLPPCGVAREPAAAGTVVRFATHGIVRVAVLDILAPGSLLAAAAATPWLGTSHTAGQRPLALVLHTVRERIQRGPDVWRYYAVVRWRPALF